MLLTQCKLVRIGVLGMTRTRDTMCAATNATSTVAVALLLSVQATCGGTQGIMANIKIARRDDGKHGIQT